MKRTVSMAATAFLVAGLISPVLALDGAKPVDKKVESTTTVDKKENVKVTEAKPAETTPTATATPSQPSIAEKTADKAADMAKEKATEAATSAVKSTVSPTSSVPSTTPTTATAA